MPRYENTAENQARMDRVAEDLEGTCQTLETVLQRHFDEDADTIHFDSELLAYLDEQVMECAECNWWSRTDEMADDQICLDCE